MKGDGALSQTCCTVLPAQDWKSQGLMLLGSLFPTCLLLSQLHLEQTGLSVGFASVSKYFVPGSFIVGKTPLARPMYQDSLCLAGIAGVGKRDFEEL